MSPKRTHTTLALQLAPVLEAIAVVSPASFTFAGITGHALNADVVQMPPAGRSENPAVALLQQYLYQYCYCKKFPDSLQSEIQALADMTDLTPELSAANVSRDRWDQNWQIDQLLPSGQILAHKHALHRTFFPGEFLKNSGLGAPPEPGAEIRVFVPRESRKMQPGFYYAFGETIADQQDESARVRFYWNIRAAGVTPLVRAVGRRLNHFQVPFRLKCPSIRTSYNRMDSGVLYIGRRFYRIVSELIADIHHQLRNHLSAPTPLFTKRLAPGLAMAEDPGTGESFGLSRCRMVAEGVWIAYEQGEQTLKARLREAEKQFAAGGTSFEHPYLNGTSPDFYQTPAFEPRENS